MEPLLFVFYLLVYIYTGFALKLIDQVNDENFELNRKLKDVILVSSPILAGIVMGMDLYNGSIGLMLIIGLFFTKKINVRDFKIYALLVVCSMVVVSLFNQFYVFVNFLSILIITVLLLLAVIADELVNGFLDSKYIENSILKKLASIRPILKIVAFVLPLFTPFTFYHAVMILCLDIAYDLTNYFTECKIKLEDDLT